MAGLSRFRVISRACTYTPCTCTCRHTQHACVHANRQRTETPKTFRHSGAHTHTCRRFSCAYAHTLSVESCTHAECGITVIVSARSHTKNRKHGHCRTPLVADTQPRLAVVVDTLVVTFASTFFASFLLQFRFFLQKLYADDLGKSL